MSWAQAPLETLFEAQLRPGGTYVAVNYGGGTNSTGMICELIRRGLRPAAVVCADTGSERPEFYRYLPIFSSWLQAQGCPPIHVTRWRRKRVSMGWEPGEFVPLHEWCLELSELPSAAFGMKGCSVKWKGQPVDALIDNLTEGVPLEVVRLFGYDADEPQRHRDTDPRGRVCRSPLIEWDWGREECAEAIRAAGLPLPGKSSCWMCPHMTGPEIGRLRRDHPDLFAQALAIEEAWLREGRREPTLAEVIESSAAVSQGNAPTVTASSIMGLGRSRRWADYTDAELEHLASAEDADNKRPCGCVDG